MWIICFDYFRTCAEKNLMFNYRHRYVILDWLLVFLQFASQVNVKAKFTLEQAMKAHRGSRGVALLFL